MFLDEKNILGLKKLDKNNLLNIIDIMKNFDEFLGYMDFLFKFALKKTRNSEDAEDLVLDTFFGCVKEMADVVGIMKGGKLVLTMTREELAKEDLNKMYLDYIEDRVC